MASSDIPFIVTKHGGQTVTYGGGAGLPLYSVQQPNKPSTPVYIGRYYTSVAAGNLSSSHHTFRGGKKIAAGKAGGGKQQ